MQQVWIVRSLFILNSSERLHCCACYVIFAHKLDKMIFSLFFLFRYIKQGERVSLDVREKGRDPQEIGLPEYSKTFL